MNLFYSKKTLNDNLVGYTQDQTNLTEIKNGEDILWKNQEGQLVGFNIANLSQKLQLPEGRIYPTPEIVKLIQTIDSTYQMDSKAAFTVGLIETCEDIEGTHLHKCTVNVGDEILDIVCGAQNAKAGLKVVVARIGVIMPNGLYIKPSKLKGFASNGMLCSQKELNLTGFNEEGIIELGANYEKGDIFKNIYVNL